MKIELNDYYVTLEDKGLDDVTVYKTDSGAYTIMVREYSNDDDAYLREVSQEYLEKFIATTIHNFKLSKGVKNALKELGDD